MSNLTPRLSADDLVTNGERKWRFPFWLDVTLILLGQLGMGFIGGVLGAYLWERFAR